MVKSAFRVTVKAALVALLVLMIGVGATTVMANASKSGGSFGDGNALVWTYDTETKALTLTGSGRMPDYRPTAAPWYKYRAQANTLTVDSSITNIGAYCFRDFTALTNLTLSSRAADIGEYAFAGCTSLAQVTIKSGTRIIDTGAFQGCTALNSVTINSGTTSVGDYAFASCGALRNVSLPNTVQTIGSYAFSGCTALESLNLGDGLTQLGVRVIENTPLLKTVLVPASLRTCKNNGNDGSFAGSSLETTSFDEKVSVIPAYLYSGCSSLKTIVIPQAVGYIGTRAFYGCSMVKLVDIPKKTTSLLADCFGGCSALRRLYVYGERYYMPFAALTDSEPVIYGYSGTALEDYAAENGLMFIPFGACGHAVATNVEYGNCMTYGTATYSCTVCGYSDVSTAFEYGPHSYVNAVTAATCTTDRHTRTICSICGDAYETVEWGSALGHDIVYETGSSADGKFTWMTGICSRGDYQQAQMNAVFTDSAGNTLPNKVFNIIPPNGPSYTTQANGSGVAVLSFSPYGEYAVQQVGTSLTFKVLFNPDGSMSVERVEEVVVPPTPDDCDCLCHDSDIWGFICRFFCYILNKMFRLNLRCCEDMVPYK